MSSGLPLVSLSRGSMGLPPVMFRGSLGSFKGPSLIQNGSCTKVFCFVCDALCPFCNSVLGSVLSDNVPFSCTLSGMLTYYSSNTNGFIRMPFLVVLYVRITLVVGSFCQHYRLVSIASIYRY